MSKNGFSEFEEYEAPALFGSSTRSGTLPGEGSLGGGTGGGDDDEE